MFYFMVVFITIIILLKHFRSVSRVSIRGKHVVITGGSSGIGKSVAIVAAQEGAHVTIIARNLDKLEKARDEIMRCCINDAQIISRISVDVSNYEDIKDEMFKLEERISPIFMLVNCAGVAICGRVEDFTEREVKRLFDANFLGTFYPVKVILPKFKQRKEGIIVLTGSQVSLMGMYGYSIYSSFKFALRGFAESLYMESKSYGITVTLALPPDTDTPGYELENRSKPIETKLISAAATLAQPDEVAKNMMDDALKGSQKNCPVKIELISNLTKRNLLANCQKLKGTKISIANDLTVQQREEQAVLRRHLHLNRQEDRTTFIKRNKLVINGREYSAEQLLQAEQEVSDNQSERKSAPQHLRNQFSTSL
ncbi:hypothetical protein JTB14_027466 [Gonioctena quinquepunctata]|nr:hypothetical protein JTB14_027466 [Gonioctena quinquepunctata]